MKMKESISEYNSICIVGTVYSLFLYLLITDEDKIESTLFILGTDIDSQIRKNLKYVISINKLKYKSGSWFSRFYEKFKLYHFDRKKIKGINNLPIYGHDHMPFSAGFIGKRNLIVIEDGLANYVQKTIVNHHNIAKRIFYPYLYGPLSVTALYGGSKYANKVILTNMDKIPNLIKSKAKIIDPSYLWNNISESHKKRILRIFNVSKSELKALEGKKYVLLTQVCDPQSQSELIGRYKKAICRYNKSECLIKTHPRDIINYKEIFPDIMVYDKRIPFELLILMGCEFEIALTVSSSSVCNLPKTTKVIYI